MIKQGAAALVALALLFPPGSAAAEHPRELDAALIWATEEHVYVVPAPRERIALGDVLEFQYRKKPIAIAKVTSHAEAVVVATVISGSFERAKKKLSKVRVFALPSQPLDPPPLLRVGMPSSTRTNLVFACAPSHVPSERPPSVYRVEVTAPEGYRLVRLAEPHALPWPDTLAIRWFDEVTDQEIALERGDLDVAVFWPGEPTARFRDQGRWGFALGERSRGFIAAMWNEGGAGDRADTTSGNPAPELDGSDRLRFAGAARLAELNEQMFRGDLVPWSARGEPFVAPAQSVVATGVAARFSVDLSFPGWRAIERFLNRGAVRDAPVVRIAYLDESTAGAVSHRDGDMRVEPLFAVRCPVVWAPERAGLIEAIGAAAWVALLGCEPLQGGP